MTPTRAKDPGQRSVCLKDRVETDGHTDGGICISCCAVITGTHFESIVLIVTQLTHTTTTARFNSVETVNDLKLDRCLAAL